MSRQLLFSKSVVFYPRYIFHLILILIFLGLVAPGVYSADRTSIYKDGEKIERSGGKRSKEEIREIIQQMRARRKTGLEEDPVERWLKQEKTTKYTVQKKFTYAVHSLKKSLYKIGRKMERDADAPSEVAELLRLRDIIKDADDALQRKYAEDEEKFKAERLPSVILTRHRDMVENHNRNIHTLFDNFDALERAAGAEAWDEVRKLAGQIQDQLDTYQAIKDPPLLDSSLPHGLRYVEAPRIQRDETAIPSMEPTRPEDDKVLAPGKLEAIGEEVLLEEAGGTISPMFITGPPGAADLDPTIDVQITQDIIDLAAGLDNSPLKIYQYVRNNLDFEPYLGSRKGSQETLNQMSGNDYDMSSLLIALLRAAGIPARYVRGIVELSPEKAMNWLGVEDAATAGSILTTVGMEGINIVDGEGSVVSIRFRHVWVEAYIPYTNYRGIPVDDTGKMWIPMDPSFKGYAYQSGVDILSEMGFDAEAFIDDYISTFHEPSPVELYMQQINDYLAVNHPELGYEDIIRIRAISLENQDFLPGSLPFTVRSVDSDFAEIPSDKRYKLRFRLYNGGTTFIDYTANLPAIAGKRITISYIAASQADQDVIDSYGDLYDTPPYLVNLKPVLKIDGNDVAVGAGSIGMGRTHSSDMHFTTPVGETNEMPVVSNSIIAGTYQAIGVDTGRIDPEIFMPAADEGTPTTDDLTGGKLWKTAMGYLDRIETYDDEVAKTMQLVVTKDVSEAIVENTILVTFSFGTPQTFEWKGLVVDADRNIVGPFAVDGDSGKQKPFMVLTGADGSVSENRIFEDLYDEEAVSTIKILELASDAGIPIYKFDSGNIGSIYSTLNLSASVENAIYSAVAAGHEVTVPRDNITYSEWYGTGYIDMEPATGAAGYIISGGHSGGATVDVWIAWKVWLFTIFRDLCDSNPITADITFPPASSYFPKLDLWDFLFNNQLKFDVTYTICYEGGGTKTVYETFRPHYPYRPGNYTFDAGSGTGVTRDFTVFGVEIETPDGEDAIAGCDSITLNTKFTPSTPPSVNYSWGTSWGLGCLLGCGNGTFTPDNNAPTEFKGTDGGDLTAKVEVSNIYGTTKGEKGLRVIGVKKIKAEDSEDGSNSVEDADKGVEANIQTIYVVKSDTGTVDISIETQPSVAEADLPADWEIEKVSGSLNFDGTPGKLFAQVKKDTPGEIVLRGMQCSGSTDHFQVKIVIAEIDLDIDSNNDGSINNADDPIEENDPGQLISYNGDDDNNNSTPDRDENGTVISENDLEQVEIKHEPATLPNGCTLILEASLGASNVKLWEAALKTTMIPLPKTYTIGTDTIPNVVYVEGVDAGAAMLDLVLKDPSNVEIGRDKVKLAVIKVDLDADSDNDGNVEETDDLIEMDDPGKLIFLNKDDDNQNDTEDRTENAAAVTSENDLQKINLAYGPPGFGYGEISLMATTGAARIQVWKNPTKGVAADLITLPKTWNLGTDTVPNSLYVEGIDSGEVVLQLEHKMGANQISMDEVKFGVVDITFAKRGDTQYGYDNGTIDDNPVPVAADHAPQKYDWVSVDRDNKTTDIDVTITPAVYATHVHFVSSNTGQLTVSPATATASPQKLTLNGKSVGKPNVLSRLGTTSGAEGYRVNVAAYTLANVNANFYKVSAAGLVPDGTTAAQFESGVNDFMKNSVTSISLTDNGTTNVNYDTNTNTQLDIDTTVAGGGAEWTAVTAALSAGAGRKVLHVKNSLRVKIGASWINASGLNWGDWIIVTDGSSSKTRTLAHETLHNLGLADTGPPASNTSNIMYYQSSATKHFVGYFKVERVVTGTGASHSPKQYEEQWDTISR